MKPATANGGGSSKAQSTALAPIWASSGSRTRTDKKLVDQTPPLPSRAVAFKLVADALNSGEFPAPAAIGHRTVCGGPTVRENQRITPATDRRDRELRGPCAAAHAHRRLHHARGAAPVPRHSELCHSRHVLPSHDARGGDAHADSRGVRCHGRAALRLSRHFV